MRILDLKLSCVVLLYFTQTISSMGLYMNRFRNSRNGTTGTKIQFTDPKPNLNLFMLRNANLTEVDQKYSLCNGVDIREISILEIQKLFEKNVLNSVTLTDCYLQRIYHMNRVLHAVIEINPDAIAEAHKADSERIEGYVSRGPMHGIPILLKDNVDTLDKTETTAGSPALLGIRPKRDADVVKLLRKAGVVIIGKSNLSEFANFRGTNVPNGWSGRGGQTVNPFNFNEDSSGSSSGSAVGVAANLVPVAVGTETDGSLISPANVGGLCTIKSTLGLISTQGVIPISHNQDTVGPLARTVMDLAIFFDAMVSEQVKNRYACEGSYMQCLLRKEYKKSFRIGVLRYPFWDLSAINSTYLEVEIPQLEAIVKTMEDLPIFDVVDPVSYAPGLLESITGSDELTVMLHDFKHGINEYLKKNVISQYSIPPQTPIKRIASLKDIIQFNIDHPSPEGYNQRLLTLAEDTDGLENPTYVEARESNQGSARRLLDYVISKYNLDAIVVPGENRGLHTDVESLQDTPIMANSVAAIAGYPSVLVPAGIGLRGVPFGINFIGRPHTEAKLLQIAYEVEKLDRPCISVFSSNEAFLQTFSYVIRSHK